MLKRIGVVAAVMGLAIFMLLPVVASGQPSDNQNLVDRSFDRAFGSSSQSQYNNPGGNGGGGGGGGGGNGGGGGGGGGGGNNANVPPTVAQTFCASIVQNTAVPLFIQIDVVQEFGLGCEPSGSFFDGFFGSFFGFFDSFFGFFGF